MKKVLNILLIALILTILWILFLVIKSSSSNVQGVKSVKTEYDNYYAEIDKKIKTCIALNEKGNKVFFSDIEKILKIITNL